jgi:hypothetical protein
VASGHFPQWIGDRFYNIGPGDISIKYRHNQAGNKYFSHAHPHARHSVFRIEQTEPVQ